MVSFEISSVFFIVFLGWGRGGKEQTRPEGGKGNGFELM